MGGVTVAGSTGGEDTAVARHRYDRIAPVYDALEWVVEVPFFRRWRRALWERVPAGRVLEVGIGTGKNLAYHRAEHAVVGIDLSPAMLDRARRRARRTGSPVDLQVADVQDLPFGDQSFDVVVATFVFCSVPDPVVGLREVRRVLKPGGKLVLLEHVIAPHPWLAAMMRWFDFVPVHIWGAHIDRDTVENVRRAGFPEVDVQRRMAGIVVEVQGGCREPCPG
jgi:phosphatidylethanolamine/phosphatidyl-N-methylethanolamine N-methyltransferase